ILSGMQSTPRQQTRDRRQAIAEAINNANPNDLVLVAGKGHETTQTIGDQVNDFSDRDVVRACLKEISQEVVH
ncbi:MAG: UDP-N-acetylmuramoyl-L-alanyl-D-glutamate--2,6-diaminopimelate ligase, partial [Gammaproteobacteria bacterium]|nr:UDP-N-acetylmuramoyl-L-alanyl-D-glutamate--2,6-diaminopimelate ligase [Gammaproteobacteria bacterium]